jgi:hypothetical protein
MPLIDPVAFQAGVWASAPVVEHRFDPSIAVLLDEQWQSYDPEATNGDWVLTQAVAGAAAISTAAPGVLELDSNSTTATQGAQVQRVKSCFVPAAGKSIWAEFQVKVVDTFDKAELFVGLSEIDTSVIASSANSSANHIGWQCVTDDGVLLFTSEKAGTGTTAAAATIAEDTWIKLGFFYDGDADTLQQYVNGVATGSAIATANIPKVALYPTAVCQSGGTNDPILHIRPLRIMQLI